MNKKIALAVIIIIIVVGIIMGCVKGFNFGLTYEQSERIQFALDRKVNKNEISEIANRIFEGQKIRVQTVELFEDTALITVQSASDEQIEKLVKIINEMYNLDYTKDNYDITKIPATSLFEIVKDYILPVSIIVLLTAIYMIVRYRKLNVLKVVLTLIISVVLTEALLASIYSIVRIPVNEFTMPIALAVLTITIFTVSFVFEKKLTTIEAQEEIL